MAIALAAFTCKHIGLYHAGHNALNCWRYDGFEVIFRKSQMRATFAGVWILWKFYTVPVLPKSGPGVPVYLFLWVLRMFYFVPIVIPIFLGSNQLIVGWGVD